MNRSGLSLFTLLITLFTTFSLCAENIVTVSNAHIRETIPGTTISSAYLTLHNPYAKALTLSKVTSKVSDRIEIHDHILEEGMMKMRQRDAIVIPANSTVTLQPGGLHLMVFNLTKPLTVDHNVLFTLHFLEGQILEVTVPVTSLKQVKPNSHKHHH